MVAGGEVEGSGQSHLPKGPARGGGTTLSRPTQSTRAPFVTVTVPSPLSHTGARAVDDVRQGNDLKKQPALIKPTQLLPPITMRSKLRNEEEIALALRGQVGNPVVRVELMFAQKLPGTLDPSLSD